MTDCAPDFNGTYFVPGEVRVKYRSRAAQVLAVACAGPVPRPRALRLVRALVRNAPASVGRSEMQQRTCLGPSENEDGQGSCPATAIAAPADLSPDAVDDDVGPAPHHRPGALCRHDHGNVVAARGSGGPECLCGFRGLLDQLDRPTDPVRLQLGDDPPCGRRHPLPHLRLGLWSRARRARVAGARQPDLATGANRAAVDRARDVWNAMKDC